MDLAGFNSLLDRVELPSDFEVVLPAGRLDALASLVDLTAPAGVRA